ncbi:hypothetical protein FYJ26_10605 [Anaerococcus sp. WCA-380-WT-2B]|uniref:Uncharacterized protein n=1 Tax=Anaerococcus porci TaxID=2652269 RepID=A0A6N7VIY1_9FIRM|nr:hypothetical protein [Anaerococcus porci]MSS78821.1 hypothetical protein [Anaerococcus porci]
MENYNNNTPRQTGDFISKKDKAEKFLDSLKQNKKQIKSKTISFKCSVKNYTLIRAKAIINNVSVADYLTDLVKKDKKKEYSNIQEKIDNFLS